jgi:hypothetical protein
LATTKAENSFYNIELEKNKGTYYLSISSKADLLISISLVKDSLIHLIPGSNSVMRKEAIFELYSLDKSAMIEVFNCKG